MNKVRMRSRSTILAIMLICVSVLVVSISTLAILRNKYKTSDNASFGKIEISTKDNFAKLNSSLLDAVAGDKLTDAITISKSESSDPMYVRIKVGFDTDSTNADVVEYVNRLNRYDFGMIKNTTGYKWSERYGRYYFLLDDADNIFSVDTSEPITLTDSFTIPFMSEEMEDNAQYLERATFSVEIQAIQSAVVKNLIDSNATPKAQLKAVDNVFAEVFGERAEILSTLSAGYLGKLGITDKSTVSSITFYDNGFKLEGVPTVDLSEDETNTIIGWSKQDSTTNLYDLYISSDQRIALPEYCSGLFAMCENVDGNMISNLKEINNMSALDTSKVISMDSMFQGCSSLIGLDVSKFDTSQVTDMSFMFQDCGNLTRLDVTSFDTSKVTNMEYVFLSCQSLENLDVSRWKTSLVYSMRMMFYNCSGLTSLDVSNFDTSQVTDMYCMFSGCSGLKNLDLTGFDTSKVTDMRNMFNFCSNLTILDVSRFNTNQVTNMERMFYYCSGLTYLDLSNFDTSKVTNMSYMFEGCTNLKTLNVSKFNTSQVTSMESMFSSCGNLTNLDLSNFDTSKVTNMYYMFAYCTNLKTLNVSKFNTSQVTNMSYMFAYCSSLAILDVSNFDTKQVIDMTCMFSGCSSLKNLDVSSFNTKQVTDMWGMFWNCSSLTALNVDNFDVSNVTNLSSLFDGCSGLVSLDLSNFATNQVNYMYQMFYNCTKLESVLLGENWSFSNISDYMEVFYESYKVKVFCVNAEQKNWLSDTSKNIISADRVFVKVSNSEVINALNSATWTDLTDYTTIQTAEFNGVTYYKVKGKAGFYGL